MKKLMIAAVIMGISLAAQAQGDAIAKFFNKYQDDDSFTQVTVSGNAASPIMRLLKLRKWVR